MHRVDWKSGHIMYIHNTGQGIKELWDDFRSGQQKIDWKPNNNILALTDDQITYFPPINKICILFSVGWLIKRKCRWREWDRSIRKGGRSAGLFLLLLLSKPAIAIDCFCRSIAQTTNTPFSIVQRASDASFDPSFDLSKVELGWRNDLFRATFCCCCYIEDRRMFCR